jgi:redox-sensitive bicupin YhaK (pirin superfamily)
MGFGPLRVINEDRVKEGAGFAVHPHNNMEIVSYVLDGALEHKDSMGNGSIIQPGEVQRMSAGTGITHSEFNHSKEKDVHFLQIWFLPEQQNIEPGYEQRAFSDDDKKGQLKLVMSRGGRDGSVDINQDVDMRVGLLSEADHVVFEPQAGRIQWVQIAKGSVQVNGEPLDQGDGLAIKEEPRLTFDQASDAEVILFDMKA